MRLAVYSLRLVRRRYDEGGRNEILADIRSFINRKDVRRFFYLPAEAQVFCEKEFVNAYGDTRRIDRLIVLKNEVWIVDYKLSPGAEDENQKQMQEYIALVKQFYPGHKVSGHILYLRTNSSMEPCKV